MSNWDIYIHLNFQLPDPISEGCLKEISKMVADRAAPHHKGGKRGKAKELGIWGQGRRKAQGGRNA